MRNLRTQARFDNDWIRREVAVGEGERFRGKGAQPLFGAVDSDVAVANDSDERDGENRSGDESPNGAQREPTFRTRGPSPAFQEDNANANGERRNREEVKDAGKRRDAASERFKKRREPERAERRRGRVRKADP